MNSSKIGKLIAPLLVTGVMVLYLAYSIMQAASFPGLIRAQPLLFIVPMALIGVSVYVLAQRIREIQSGEEDDLDKY